MFSNYGEVYEYIARRLSIASIQSICYVYTILVSILWIDTIGKEKCGSENLTFFQKSEAIVQ